MDIIIIVFAILLLIWYFAPLYSKIFNVGNQVGAVISVLLLLFGIFFYKMPPLMVFIISLIILIIFAVVIIPISLKMEKYANYKTDENADVVIILGCKVKGKKPSKYLYDRCVVASEYLKKNENAIAVLSGGQGKDEEISEAVCMKNVLTELGIDEKRLYLEENSTSTYENIKYSTRIIKENKLSRNVLIVTNEFHEYRAKLIADEFRLNFHSKSSKSSFYTFLTFYTREIMGIIAKKILKK